MKKRFLALMLAISMLGVFLTGCGSEGETQTEEIAAESTGEKEGEGNVDLSVFWWGNQIRNERTLKVLEMYEEEHGNIKIDGQFADGMDYWTRLATMAAGGTVTDVLQMETSYLSRYGQNGSLLDLTPYIEDGTIDVTNIPESVIDLGYIDGKLCGICIAMGGDCLFYNKTLLDEAGITVKDYMTIEEFKNVCREVYEKTGYKTSLAYYSGLGSAFLEYLLRGQGSLLYGENSFAVENADAFVEYFQLMEDGIKEGWHVDPGVYIERQEASVEQDCLVYGESPEYMSWCAFYSINQISAFNSAAPEGVEISATTMPSSDPMKSIYNKASQYWSISADSDNPDEAAKLINYVINSVDANKVLMTDRGVPVSAVVGDAIAEDMTEKENEMVEFINDVVTPYATPANPPAPAKSSEIKELLKSISEKLLYGQISAQEAAESFFEQGNQILASE